MKQANADFDIVIVGGGIAGIYTAWRLTMADEADSSKLKKWKKKSKLRIAVYEGSDTSYNKASERISMFHLWRSMVRKSTLGRRLVANI